MQHVVWAEDSFCGHAEHGMGTTLLCGQDTLRRRCWLGPAQHHPSSVAPGDIGNCALDDKENR